MLGNLPLIRKPGALTVVFGDLSVTLLDLEINKMDEMYFPFESRAKSQKNIKILQGIHDSRLTLIIDSRCVLASFQTKDQTKTFFWLKKQTVCC